MNNNTEMQVVLLFYSSLGGHSGKGNESFYVANELKKRGYLKRVLVLSKNAELDSNVIEEALLVRRISGVLGRIEKHLLKQCPSRLWSEILFDFFSNRKLPKDGQILYLSPRMVYTIESAKRLGYLTIVHSGELHPQSNMQTIEEECRRLDIKSRHPGWDTQLFRRYLKSIQLADYILVHSDFARQNYIFQGVPEDKLFINPLGVDLNKFHPTTLSQKEFVFLFVGTLSIIKGVQYLIEAWNGLKLRDAKLVICGSMGIDFKETLCRYSSLRNVKFTGLTDPIPYYQKASLFVFPSLSEGMARVTIEAMAMGLPVITTPNAGSVVRSGQDGFLVPARDTEMLKEKMLYFYENRSEVERMGRNARQQAEKYTWGNYGRRTVNIIEEICGLQKAML